MHQNWYKNSMPKIKEAQIALPKICNDIKKINGVKNVFVFGSFTQNESNPNFPIRDLDIIAQTNFDSGDLLSISNENSFLSEKDMESEGFNPKAISFTKQFIKISDFNIDHWAISKNKNLLHWGAMNEDKDEWENVKKDAEEYANKQTGLVRSKLKCDKNKFAWKTEHDYFMELYLKDIPVGWYQSNCKIKEILNTAKKL